MVAIACVYLTAGLAVAAFAWTGGGPDSAWKRIAVCSAVCLVWPLALYRAWKGTQ